MAHEQPYYGVIEAGGTKFNCAIVTREREIVAQQRIPTLMPKDTIEACIAFFENQIQAGYDIKQIGIASFGPIVLDPQSNEWGYFSKTPKPGWSHTPFAPVIRDALGVEVTIDTDVNAPALAEYKWGVAKGCESVVYITVGTGLGGGVVINGKPLHGVTHPEIGHMVVVAPEGQTGTCPFHECCAEGLISGAALGKIWGTPAHELGDEHPAWESFAFVMGQVCRNLMLCFSPNKIIFGGGVMQKPGLLDKVVVATQEQLGGYIAFPEGFNLEDILCLPDLGDKVGILGALALLDQRA